MTQLKRVQKENEQLRGQREMLKREADYWERQAKTFEMYNESLKKANAVAHDDLKNLITRIKNMRVSNDTDN